MFSSHDWAQASLGRAPVKEKERMDGLKLFAYCSDLIAVQENQFDKDHTQSYYPLWHYWIGAADTLRIATNIVVKSLFWSTSSFTLPKWVGFGNGHCSNLNWCLWEEIHWTFSKRKYNHYFNGLLGQVPIKGGSIRGMEHEMEPRLGGIWTKVGPRHCIPLCLCQPHVLIYAYTYSITPRA